MAQHSNNAGRNMRVALPLEWQAELRRERQAALEAARDFAFVCQQGKAKQLYDEHLIVNKAGAGAWRLAMREVAQLGKVSRSIQKAFIRVWVEHKHLPLAVGDRRICAAALRVLMPGGYKRSMTLYRGDDARRRRIHGFSWTTDIKIAREFAMKNKITPLGDGSGTFTRGVDGVVLRTLAPASAILLVRKREDYYDEDEVVVDPYKLSTIEMIERLPASMGETVGPPSGVG
jgi:hypothetical protein